MLPQVGTLVWYWSDPTRRPQAAIVAKRVSYTSFNLSYCNAQTGVWAAATAVPFLENPGLEPASGVYCTPTGIQDDIDGASDVTSPTSRVTAAAVQAGGANYAVGNTITLSNGVVLTVATVTTGAVATVTITNPGSVVTASIPANPVAQVSTSGSGTGATFNLTWTGN